MKRAVGTGRGVERDTWPSLRPQRLGKLISSDARRSATCCVMASMSADQRTLKLQRNVPENYLFASSSFSERHPHARALPRHSRCPGCLTLVAPLCSPHPRSPWHRAQAAGRQDLHGGLLHDPLPPGLAAPRPLQGPRSALEVLPRRACQGRAGAAASQDGRPGALPPARHRNQRPVLVTARCLALWAMLLVACRATPVASACAMHDSNDPPSNFPALSRHAVHCSIPSPLVRPGSTSPPSSTPSRPATSRAKASLTTSS